MKKNSFRRIVSIALSLVMLLGAAPLNGIAELDFAKLNIFGGINLPSLSSLFGTEASAEGDTASGICGDNLRWWLDAGTLTIIGEGAMYDYQDQIDSWSGYEEDINTVSISGGVTSIGERAFYGCTGLENISIPDSVTSIGDGAFHQCTGLTSITIPDSVTGIGSYAFAGCDGLTSITIPGSVTSIGYESFCGCGSLSDVYFTGTQEQWNAIEIGEHNDCLLDANIHFNIDPLSVLTYEINDNEVTITGCESSAAGELIIPDSINSFPVTIIGDRAFANCNELTSITIPDSVTNISYYAFENCIGLTSITIPDSVISIGFEAFGGCGSLLDVYFTGTQEQWNAIEIDDANDCLLHADIHFDALDLIYSLSVLTYEINDIEVTITGCDKSASGNLVIPDTIERYLVTSIDDSAFNGCDGITSITIPDSVTNIEGRTFENCTGLTSLTIPIRVTSIGYSAFSGCTGLAEITIPENVRIIGDSAFAGCESLSDIYYYGSESQWESIDVGNDNAVLTTATVYFYIVPDWIYTSGNDGVVITGYRGNEREISIPATIEFLKVTGISSEAFYRRSYITAVTIPDSVTSIGSSAFEECTGLRSVTIGKGITSIGERAFKGCTQLESVYFNAEN